MTNPYAQERSRTGVIANPGFTDTNGKLLSKEFIDYRVFVNALRDAQDNGVELNYATIADYINSGDDQTLKNIAIISENQQPQATTEAVEYVNELDTLYDPPSNDSLLQAIQDETEKFRTYMINFGARLSEANKEVFIESLKLHIQQATSSPDGLEMQS